MSTDDTGEDAEYVDDLPGGLSEEVAARFANALGKATGFDDLIKSADILKSYAPVEPTFTDEQWDEIAINSPSVKTASHTAEMSKHLGELVATATRTLAAAHTGLEVSRELLVRAEASLKLSETARVDAKLADERAARSEARAAASEKRAARIGFWSMILTGASFAVAIAALVVAIVQMPA
ncbi:hypothetical protein [Pseudoclavibacter helvolus]|uniref:hypothetical protein n=1 Tax=Pseudoclavibacter helvolus TaxID=255205 RepID=UPI0035ED5ADB